MWVRVCCWFIVPPEPFSQYEVDALVSAAKYVKSIPPSVRLDRGLRSGKQIRIDVFKKAERGRSLGGLFVLATVNAGLSGLPKPYPGVALRWHGLRIRGLNYELWHDNPDGTVIKGWHEHVWSQSDGDSCVIQARPEVKRIGSVDVLRWDLGKWNIEVEALQEDLYE